MRRVKSRLWVGLGAAATWAVAVAAIERAPAGPTDAPPIERLVAQLASREPKVRDAAVAQLGGRADAEPALRRALRSPDAEVVRLARRALAERARRSVPVAAKRALASAAAGAGGGADRDRGGRLRGRPRRQGSRADRPLRRLSEGAPP